MINLARLQRFFEYTFTPLTYQMRGMNSINREVVKHKIHLFQGAVCMTTYLNEGAFPTTSGAAYYDFLILLNKSYEHRCYFDELLL